MMAPDFSGLAIICPYRAFSYRTIHHRADRSNRNLGAWLLVNGNHIIVLTTKPKDERIEK